MQSEYGPHASSRLSTPARTRKTNLHSAIPHSYSHSCPDTGPEFYYLRRERISDKELVRTMLVCAVACHAFKHLPRATQSLVLIIVVINLIKGSHSFLSRNGKVTYQLYSGSSRFP